MRNRITDVVSLGKAIREKRKKMSFTQAYLSEVTGLSVTFISDLENGKATIELGKTILLINMLGMDVLLEERG